MACLSELNQRSSCKQCHSFMVSCFRGQHWWEISFHYISNSRMLCHDHFKKSFHRHTHWDRIDKYASFPISIKVCAATTSFFKTNTYKPLGQHFILQATTTVSPWKSISMPIMFTLSLWGGNVLKIMIYMVKLTHYLNTFPLLPSSKPKSRYASCYQSSPKQSPLEPLRDCYLCPTELQDTSHCSC